ncbi:MAG TPA: Na+/H+ antiporter NhaA [Jiangellales bacterium]|nr:Na+/H+ antiporter NhaA [Jiangellales bacterium]
MSQEHGGRSGFLERLPLTERTTLTGFLRNETTGGLLMLAATVVALVWANSALSESYVALSELTFGPVALDLNLDVAHWTADGLLAVFFLVAGLELKRELVVGSLSNPAAAALPVVAAVCGMAVPALIYVAVNLSGGDLRGWAIPTATDIAFALAVLAVIGSRLPTALRAFLLTLAVVDDLLAIIIIAVFFTSDLEVVPLLVAVALLALYAALQARRVTGWWVYVPIGLAAWALVHASGVHATVAGVAIGLLTRVRRDRDEAHSPAERLEHRIQPFSAAVCVPLFALFAAGVPVSRSELAAVFTEPVGLGIVLGLVLGKTLGIFGGSWLTFRFTRAQLNPDLAWSDVLGLSMLAGIGFTVSLLISDLAFRGGGSGGVTDLAKASVLVASLIAALGATVILRMRNTVYRRISDEDERDDDMDGIPDVYQREDVTDPPPPAAPPSASRETPPRRA